MRVNQMVSVLFLAVTYLIKWSSDIVQILLLLIGNCDVASGRHNYHSHQTKTISRQYRWTLPELLLTLKKIQNNWIKVCCCDLSFNFIPQDPNVFFCFYLLSVFSSSAVYLASDVFTILRLIHVVNQNWVFVQWSNQKWFLISVVFIFFMAFMSTFGAFLDLVPLYFYKNLTYDLFLAFWFTGDYVQYYVQILMHLSWMTYTLGLSLHVL